MNGNVVGLFLRGAAGETPGPVDQVSALVGNGLADDYNGKRASQKERQVLLTHVGDLALVGLEPGDLREQITVDLPGLMTLPRGARLEIGEVVLHITRDCEPCTHIGALVGHADRAKFQRELVGRRGMFGSVAEVSGAGCISVGDGVRLLEPAPQA